MPVGFAYYILPAGQMVESGLGMGVNVFVPSRCISWFNCFDLNAHSFLLREDSATREIV